MIQDPTVQWSSIEWVCTNLRERWRKAMQSINRWQRTMHRPLSWFAFRQTGTRRRRLRRTCWWQCEHTQPLLHKVGISAVARTANYRSVLGMYSHLAKCYIRSSPDDPNARSNPPCPETAGTRLFVRSPLSVLILALRCILALRICWLAPPNLYLNSKSHQSKECTLSSQKTSWRSTRRWILTWKCPEKHRNAC